MTALTLLAIAAHDLVGALAPARWTAAHARRSAVLLALLAALLGTGALLVAGQPGSLALGALLCAAAVLTMWVALGTERPLGLLGVAATVGVLAVLELGLGSEGRRFAPAPLVLVAVAAALAETANRITRAVLQLAGRPPGADADPGADGATAPDGAAPADERGTLRGGRYIGPMERALMIVLGLAHAWPVIAALMAAKGIVRFPEISADRGEGSRAEEFLVGSLTSWGLAALGGLLVWLALGMPPTG